MAWRLDCFGAGDLPFAQVWRSFTDRVPSTEVRALVLGPWWDEEYCGLRPALELMVADAGRFPELRALFLADVTVEECEISWLQLTDVTPVLEAFPRLEEFGVRGGDPRGLGEEPLSLRPVRHEALRVLRFESGGLPGQVVRAVGACELPALEHLELWLGVSQYGGDASVADLAPILSGGRFPALRHLGLQDSEVQDEIAAAVASAPVVARLASLSLSMGTLTDTGAEALLQGQPLHHLERLDLRHHFLSDATADRVRAAVGSGGTEVDLSEQQTPHRWGEEEWRYVAVSE
ncbi:STM4015 family protein [Streptomyces sp. JJ36]|nr:STM4015 family protein [Streptomyces sp. JJ36]